ncbi:MAG: FKBP-type peptidyl-prolyl cis-trans isomerase [Longimicrobiales bacterium]
MRSSRVNGWGRVFGGGLLTATLTACASGPPAPGPDEVTYAPETEVDLSRMERTSSGLYIEEISEGVGKNAVRGDRVRIHFIGWLPDGTLVDSSLAGEPYEFELGSDEVIRGWNQGIVGMKVGGRRRLVIRPGLGYGPRGRAPRVPPDAVLIFEIQLLDAN